MPQCWLGEKLQAWWARVLEWFRGGPPEHELSIYHPLLDPRELWWDDAVDYAGPGNGSLVFLGDSDEEVLEEVPNQMRYSEFLMRESVIDQRLRGVAEMEHSEKIERPEESDDGGRFGLDGFDHDLLGARRAEEAPEGSVFQSAVAQGVSAAGGQPPAEPAAGVVADGAGEDAE